ncbi:MAG: hypothetical protein WCL37_06015 [Chrysiogenales bacterium]
MLSVMFRRDSRNAPLRVGRTGQGTNRWPTGHHEFQEKGHRDKYCENSAQAVAAICRLIPAGSLVDLEKVQKIRKKYNLGILFVLPCDKATANWMEKSRRRLPAQVH